MLNGNGNGAEPQPAQPQTFDGATPVPITLQLNVWNSVLTQLADGPWKVVDPLIKELHRQIEVALKPQQQRPTLGEPALNRAE